MQRRPDARQVDRAMGGGAGDDEDDEDDKVLGTDEDEDDEVLGTDEVPRCGSPY